VTRSGSPNINHNYLIRLRASNIISLLFSSRFESIFPDNHVKLLISRKEDFGGAGEI
jgi:hypothetical protein